MTSVNRRSVLGGMVALVVPSAAKPAAAAFDLQHWIDTANPEEVAIYLGQQLAAAMFRANPDRSWRSIIDHKHHFALICGDPT